jgi:peptide/nickel transport system substrate-binding protein
LSGTELILFFGEPPAQLFVGDATPGVLAAYRDAFSSVRGWSPSATVGPEAIDQIENAGGQVIVSPTHNIMTLMINSVREGPLQDVRIRQAMNYGVNKQVFIDTVLRGLVRAAGQPLKIGDVGYNPNVKPYPYDPEKAKQLLAEAGYPNGIKLTAEVVTSLGEFSSAQQHIASDLARVGIDLELKVITTPILIKKILNQQPWDGDAFSMQFESFPTGDGGRPMDTHSCNFFFDSRWICDKAIMPTIIAAGSEMDLKKRVALLQEAMQYYHDNALALFMYERAQFDAMSSNVKNYELVNRAINWHELELTR